ncbi:T9SS type A sorting domain-containing protein [Filimonas effusa]|uniref:Secretion system C-terminal sorting domain-containing protein n=1 Tax=Filimonas effusa TaxID=2508721 RepID=A0A4Q1D9C6_9BACT|nr:T9SS type A sorting domain-containing protein [Filimonas effusa]RXK85977.1 hypothetical protein ESB13_03975 [Filimonas effusa]
MKTKLLLLPITLIAFHQFNFLFSQGLVISNGSNIVVNGATSIVINNGGINNSGSFNASTGTIVFTGTSTASLSGASTSSFYNLTVNKPGSFITLGHNVGVTHSLTMETGHLNLNGFDLDLGATGSLTGEKPASRVIGPNGGYLISSAILNAPNKANPGNIGLEITASANPGLVTLKRGHQSRQLSGGFGIHRYYDITAANNIGENATLRFHYFDEELGGVSESELGVYSVTSVTPGGELEIKSFTDPIANYVEVNGAALAGVFVPASTISDPARSSYFTVTPVDSRALLRWGTFYEINADRFELERAVGNSGFQRFANVPAAGTVATPNDYNYTDPEPLKGPYFGTSPRYYRYKVIFKDGSFRYSNIISVAPEGYPSEVLSIYPSPSYGPVNVRFSSVKNQRVVLQVLDNLGSIVAQAEMNALTGANLISCDISHVARGTYYVRLIGIAKQAYKILKQ